MSDTFKSNAARQHQERLNLYYEMSRVNQELRAAFTDAMTADQITARQRAEGDLAGAVETMQLALARWQIHLDRSLRIKEIMARLDELKDANTGG